MAISRIWRVIIPFIVLFAGCGPLSERGTMAILDTIQQKLKNISLDEFTYHRKKWIEENDAESLSWLYSSVISCDDGLRSYEEVVTVLGEPTENFIERNDNTNYISKDGATNIAFFWTKSVPRVLDAWTQEQTINCKNGNADGWFFANVAGDFGTATKTKIDEANAILKKLSPRTQTKESVY